MKATFHKLSEFTITESIISISSEESENKTKNTVGIDNIWFNFLLFPTRNCLVGNSVRKPFAFVFDSLLWLLSRPVWQVSAQFYFRVKHEGRKSIDDITEEDRIGKFISKLFPLLTRELHLARSCRSLCSLRKWVKHRGWHKKIESFSWIHFGSRFKL